MKIYNPIKKNFFNILLLLISTTITFYISDIALGKYTKIKKDYFEEKCSTFDAQKFTDSRGFSILNAYYEINDTVQHCGQEWNYIYHIDSKGFRSNGNKNIDKKILAIGDSFTFGFGVEDNQTFPALLDATNAGMWGNPFDIQLKSFKRAVQITHPKVILWGIYPPHIITMMNGEWSSNCPGNVSYLTQNTNSIKAKTTRYLIQEILIPLKQRSNIVQYILNKKFITKIEVENESVNVFKDCYATKEVILYNTNLADNNYTSDKNVNKTFLTDRTKVYNEMATYFKQAKDIADKENTEIYFFIIPSKLNLKLKDGSYPKNIDRKSLDSDLPTTTIKNILANVGFDTKNHFIDLSQYFEKTNKWEDYYFQNDAHWNLKGHEFVAQIFKYLLVQN